MLTDLQDYVEENLGFGYNVDTYCKTESLKTITLEDEVIMNYSLDFDYLKANIKDDNFFNWLDDKFTSAQDTAQESFKDDDLLLIDALKVIALRARFNGELTTQHETIWIGITTILDLQREMLECK